MKNKILISTILIWTIFVLTNSANAQKKREFKAVYDTDSVLMEINYTLSGKIEVNMRLESGTSLFKLDTNNTVTINTLDISANAFKPKIYSQNTEPDIPNDTTAFWYDADDNKYYIVVDVGGTQKKIELL